MHSVLLGDFQDLEEFEREAEEQGSIEGTGSKHEHSSYFGEEDNCFCVYNWSIC